MVIRHQQIINCWLTVSGIHMDKTRLISNRKSDGLFYLSCAYIKDNLHVELKFTDDSIILSVDDDLLKFQVAAWESLLIPNRLVHT